jgi:putative IMPACT (imprinted ancient) family translation regulator
MKPKPVAWKKVQEAVSLKVTIEYRDLSNIEKAVKMYNEKNISKRIVAKVCDLSREVVERAKKIVKESRNIGLIERSRLLTLEYEVELVR